MADAIPRPTIQSLTVQEQQNKQQLEEENSWYQDKLIEVRKPMMAVSD